MKFLKKMVLVGALAGSAGGILPSVPAQAQEAMIPPTAATRISEDQLGQMIASLGLTPEKKAQRYDFAFQSELDGAAWEFSMSAVLSQDGESLWIMAWLDALPPTAAKVPQVALLKLLAQNDQMGQGKFFAYVPNNRRFVLERVVANENLNSTKLKLLLMDLGTSVAETRPVWSTANWDPTGVPNAPVSAVGVPPAAAPAGAPIESALNESKFEQPVRR